MSPFNRVGQTRRGRSMIEKAPRRSILESPRHPDRESLPVLYVRFRRLFVVAEQEIDRFNGNAFPRTQPPLPRASSSPSSPFLFSMRSQYNVEFFCRRCHDIRDLFQDNYRMSEKTRIFLSELHTRFQISGAYSNRW